MRGIVDALLGWAQEEIKQGRFKTALHIYNDLIELKPQIGRVHYARGNLYLTHYKSEPFLAAAGSMLPEDALVAAQFDFEMDYAENPFRHKLTLVKVAECEDRISEMVEPVTKKPAAGVPLFKYGLWQRPQNQAPAQTQASTPATSPTLDTPASSVWSWLPCNLF